jgi:hypothetical protein
MSVRTRLERLEAIVAGDDGGSDDVVVTICDQHGSECGGDEDHPTGCITVRIVDRSVLEPPRTAAPEFIEALRREARARAGPHTVH